MKKILVLAFICFLTAPLSIKAQNDTIMVRANIVEKTISNFKGKNVTARFVESCETCFTVTDMTRDTTNAIEKLALYKKRVLIQADMLVFSNEVLPNLKKIDVNNEAVIQQLQTEIDERVVRQNKLKAELNSKRN
jgi:hypothetical protein